MDRNIEELEVIVAPTMISDQRAWDRIVDMWLDGVHVTVNGNPLWQ